MLPSLSGFLIPSAKKHPEKCLTWLPLGDLVWEPGLKDKAGFDRGIDLFEQLGELGWVLVCGDR